MSHMCFIVFVVLLQNSHSFVNWKRSHNDNVCLYHTNPGTSILSAHSSSLNTTTIFYLSLSIWYMFMKLQSFHVVLLYRYINQSYLNLMLPNNFQHDLSFNQSSFIKRTHSMCCSSSTCSFNKLCRLPEVYLVPAIPIAPCNVPANPRTNSDFLDKELCVSIGYIRFVYIR